MVLICSKRSYSSGRVWKQKFPFDFEGREVLIFESERDLKVNLAKYVFDTLYKTAGTVLSWIPQSSSIHLESSSKLIFNQPALAWSDIPIAGAFVMTFDVDIHSFSPIFEGGKYPDFRIHLSSNTTNDPKGYPKTLIIFPWELQEMSPGVDMYECHIDSFVLPEHQRGARMQQIAICNAYPSSERLKFSASLTYNWPNLVFESSLFSVGDRIFVSLRDLRQRGIQIELPQYLGIESTNANLVVNNIRVIKLSSSFL